MYAIHDKTENKSYNLSIGSIIKYIKDNPLHEIYKEMDSKQELINNQIAVHTLFICHRINTAQELKEVDSIFGIEIDLRDSIAQDKKQIILSHDPFCHGETFHDYLRGYDHQLMILNVKSDRIEPKCLASLEEYKINKYFFLDSSFPLIYFLNKELKNNNVAYRYSEYETLDSLKIYPDFYQWIWIDCFSRLPLTTEIYSEIQLLNKKICIVSPELQKQKEKIKTYKKQLEDMNIIPDAICCKYSNIIYWL